MNTEGDLHVEPINDLHPHIASGGACPCKPKAKWNEGTFVWVHNSYDGREHRELGHRKEICEVCSAN